MRTRPSTSFKALLNSLSMFRFEHMTDRSLSGTDTMHESAAIPRHLFPGSFAAGAVLRHPHWNLWADEYRRAFAEMHLQSEQSKMIIKTNKIQTNEYKTTCTCMALFNMTAWAYRFKGSGHCSK